MCCATAGPRVRDSLPQLARSETKTRTALCDEARWLSKVSCLLTSPHAAWAELELSPRHRAPRDRGGTALLLRRPRLRRRGRRHPRPHRTFLALASRRRRVGHRRPSCRLAPRATAFNPPECRCPSRPPSELSLPRRGHPPELTAAACRVGSLRGLIAPGDRPRAAIRAVVFVRVVWCISFEVQTLEFKRGEPCALSYRVVRSCRGGAVYEKYYDGRAKRILHC